MTSCNCIPAVKNPRFRANLATGGICIYAVGETQEDALRNLARHAAKDGIPRSQWAEVYLETMTGELVRDRVPFREVS